MHQVIQGDSLEVTERAIKWNQEHPKRRKEICQKYYRKSKQKVLDYQKEYYQRIKSEVLTFYSNSNRPKCVWCGEERLACLSIDHIAGGGNKERKRLGLEGVHFYRWLRKQGFPEGYQTLCMNCQFIKRQGGKHERSRYTE